MKAKRRSLDLIPAIFRESYPIASRIVSDDPTVVFMKSTWRPASRRQARGRRFRAVPMAPTLSRPPFHRDAGSTRRRSTAGG